MFRNLSAQKINFKDWFILTEVNFNKGFTIYAVSRAVLNNSY